MDETLRILVVEDESLIASLLASALGYEGWRVETARNGSAALAVANEFSPDLVLLDIGLPDMDGFTLLRMLRASHPNLPVIFLTARDSLDDRVRGLRSGGDDYVVKPFELAEVVARIQAVLRRGGVAGSQPSSVLSYMDVELDEDRHLATRAGTDLELTATEFDLLRYLLQNADRVVSKSQILDAVWHFDFGGKSNVVELYISYLRKKLDALGDPLIVTVRGVGYSLRQVKS